MKSLSTLAFKEVWGSSPCKRLVSVSRSNLPPPLLSASLVTMKVDYVFAIAENF